MAWALRFIALAAFALPGCGGSTSTTIPRTNAQTTTVTVLAGSTPVAGITVSLSTGIAGVSPTGVLTTMVTDPYSAGFCTLFKFDCRIGGTVTCSNAARLLRIR